jgi:tRNA-specific 2-thiouridylase
VIVGRKEEITTRNFTVEQCNWFSPNPEEDQQLQVKIRYNSPALSCRIGSGRDRVQVVLEEPAVITPGQSAVFYQDDLVLGGGIICLSS